MISRDKVKIGTTYICKYQYLSDDSIFELTFLGFSDSGEFVKCSNINGHMYWVKCEDYKIVDTVTSI